MNGLIEQSINYILLFIIFIICDCAEVAKIDAKNGHYYNYPYYYGYGRRHRRRRRKRWGPVKDTK